MLGFALIAAMRVADRKAVASVLAEAVTRLVKEHIMNYTQGPESRDDSIHPGDYSARRIPPWADIPSGPVREQQYWQIHGPQPPPPPYSQRPPSSPSFPRQEARQAPTTARQPQTAPAHGVGEGGLSLVEKLLLRGMRGDLIREPWFKAIRDQHADEFTYGSTVVVVFFSILVSGVSSVGTVGTIIWHVLYASLWLGWGYLLAALGTKRAHQFLLWAVCIGGAAGGLVGAWMSFAGLQFLHRVDQFAESFGVPPTAAGLIVADMVLGLATAALFGYLGLMVYRGLRRLRTVR